MAPLIQFAPQTTSVTPSTNQNLIGFVTATIEGSPRSIGYNFIKAKGEEFVAFKKNEAEVEAKNAAEVQKKQEDLRRLAEEYIEGLRQQASTGQIINKDSLKMVEHIAHLLKDDSITLGLQTDLMEHGVEYNPKAPKKAKVKTEPTEPIQFAGALKSPDKEEAA